jgi:hypothetical protein
MPDEKDVAYEPVSRRRCPMLDVTEALLRRNYSDGSSREMLGGSFRRMPGEIR